MKQNVNLKELLHSKAIIKEPSFTYNMKYYVDITHQ